MGKEEDKPMEAIEQQILEIGARANFWLTVSEVCGWAGFGLSLVALVWLIVTEVNERRETEYGKHRR